MLLGFSSGLPLALSGSTLLVWVQRDTASALGTIGLFTLVGTPYTLKFLWAPLIDALRIPLLDALASGRRRGWLVFSQLLLIGCDPAAGADGSSAFAIFGRARRAAGRRRPPRRRISLSMRSASKVCRKTSRRLAWHLMSRPIASAWWSSTAGALFLVTGFRGCRDWR